MINKFLKIFAADKSDPESKKSVSRRITNEQLVKILENHFRGGVKQYSVGRRMLYPMKFDVLLHPDDYNSLKDTLQFIISEITFSFYNVIREFNSKYKDYTPVADSWVFRFAPCDIDKYIVEGESFTIEPGKPVTIGSFFCEGLNGRSNPSVDTDCNVQLSVCCNNSVVMEGKNINPEILRIVDVLSEGFFRQNFDKTLGEEKAETECAMSSAEPASQSNRSTDGQKYATLSYTKNGMNYHYNMLDSTVKISGSSETQNRRDIFVIDSPDIQCGHIRIRTTDRGQSFSLAAFGPANLNGRSIPPSDSEEIRWVNLANNSQIFINSSIAVKFSVNK